MSLLQSFHLDEPEKTWEDSGSYLKLVERKGKTGKIKEF